MSIIIPKYVLFDFDGTLSDFQQAKETAKKAITPLIAEKGIDVKDYWAHYESIFEPLFARYINHELTVTEYRLMRFTHHGITTEDAARYNDIYLSIVHKAYPFSDALPCLNELKKRGHRIYILTNGPESQREKIEACELHPFIERIFISAEIGCGKPDVGAYQFVLQEIGAKPDEVLMVGDNAENDCFAAERAGVRAIQILRNKKATPEYSPYIYSLNELL